jgi:hypothetical protein
MSGIIKPYISNGITDLELRKSLDSIIRTIDALDVSITNEDPNTTKTRGGRLHYNAATSNLFVFRAGTWNPVSPTTFKQLAEIYYLRNPADAFPATPTGGTYTLTSATAGSVTTFPSGGWAAYGTIAANANASSYWWYKSRAVVVSDSTTGVVTDLGWTQPEFLGNSSLNGLARTTKVTVYYQGTNTPGTGTDNANVISGVTVSARITWLTGLVDQITGPDDTNASGQNVWSIYPATRNPESVAQGVQYSAVLTFIDQTGSALTTTTTTSQLVRGTSFNGMVTFTDYAGASTDRFGATTTIHGGRIETNTIATTQLSATAQRTLGFGTIISSGAGHSPPTTRTDGLALQVGDKYHDTTTQYQYMFFQAASQSTPQWNRLSIFADSIDVNFLNAQTIVANRIQTGTLTFSAAGSGNNLPLISGVGVVEQITGGYNQVQSLGPVTAFGYRTTHTHTTKNDTRFNTGIVVNLTGKFRHNSSSGTVGFAFGLIRDNSIVVNSSSQTYNVGAYSYVPLIYSVTIPIVVKGSTYEPFVQRTDQNASTMVTSLSVAGTIHEVRFT